MVVKKKCLCIGREKEYNKKKTIDKLVQATDSIINFYLGNPVSENDYRKEAKINRTKKLGGTSNNCESTRVGVSKPNRDNTYKDILNPSYKSYFI